MLAYNASDDIQESNLTVPENVANLHTKKTDKTELKKYRDSVSNVLLPLGQGGRGGMPRRACQYNAGAGQRLAGLAAP